MPSALDWMSASRTILCPQHTAAATQRVDVDTYPFLWEHKGDGPEELSEISDTMSNQLFFPFEMSS